MIVSVFTTTIMHDIIILKIIFWYFIRVTNIYISTIAIKITLSCIELISLTITGDCVAFPFHDNTIESIKVASRIRMDET